MAAVGVMWVQEMRAPPPGAPGTSGIPRPSIGDATPSAAQPQGSTLPAAAPAPQLALTGAVFLEVHVSPATSGEQGTAVVRLNSARDLRRVSLTLDFDPSAARVLSVSAGDFAGVDEAALHYGQPGDGARGIVMRLERPAGNLPPGDAALAVVSFEALAESAPRFQLAEVVVTDAAGNSVVPSR